MVASDKLRIAGRELVQLLRRSCSAAKFWIDEAAPPRTWARTVGILCGCVILASCREGVVDPHGPVGAAERVILGDATAIMLAVVIPVIILTLAFAWWFRAGNRRATYRPDVGVFRSDRADHLGHSGAGHPVPGRHRLDWLP